jgi:hypothetical protein
MKYLKRNLIFGLLFMLLIVCGCGGKSNPGFYINHEIDFSYIKRVAVLPLDNLTGDKFAGDAVRHVVMSELLATGLAEVSCPGDAIAALESMKIKPGQALNAEQIKAIGKALNVQAVVLGAVNKCGEVREGNISSPEVAVTLMMADAGSGSIIWSITKTRGGAGFWARHFGARSATMSETVLLVVREALQTLYKY